MPFNSDLNNPDVLENFDFDQFLQTTDGDFKFDPSAFEAGDGIEIGGGPKIHGPFDLEQSSRDTDTSQFESAERVVNEEPESRRSMSSWPSTTRSRHDRDTSMKQIDEHSPSPCTQLVLPQRRLTQSQPAQPTEPSWALSPAFPPNWRIARATSAAPMYLPNFSPTVQQGGSFSASAAGAEYENPIPGHEDTHPFAPARVDQAEKPSAAVPDDGAGVSSVPQPRKRPRGATLSTGQPRPVDAKPRQTTRAVSRAGTISVSSMPRRLYFEDSDEATLAEEAKKEADKEVLSHTDPATSKINEQPTRKRRTGSLADSEKQTRTGSLGIIRGPPALATEKYIQKQAYTFQCALCPKKFTRAYNLRSHLRTHTEERPFPCTTCGEAFARLFDLKRHMALHNGKESHVGEHDLGRNVISDMNPDLHPDLSLHLDDNIEWPPLPVEAAGPTYPTSTLSPSALEKPESRETQDAATTATSIQDPHIGFGIVDSVLEKEQVEPWQREGEQGESRLADMEVADRLVLLWTTVKPL